MRHDEALAKANKNEEERFEKVIKACKDSIESAELNKKEALARAVHFEAVIEYNQLKIQQAKARLTDCQKT